MSRKSDSRNLPWAFLVILILVSATNFLFVAPYFMALFLGWLLAAVLRPIDRRLLARNWKPSYTALVSTLIATFTIIVPIVVFGFFTAKSLVKALAPLSKGVSIQEWSSRISAFPMVSTLFETEEDLTLYLNEAIQGGVQKIGGFVGVFLSQAPGVLLQLSLALLACYFVLRDGARVARWLSPRFPLSKRVKIHLSKALNDTAYSSFLSMFFASIAQATVVLAGFILLKAPLPGLAFGIAFVFAWLPILGVTPVWVAGMVYLFFVHRIGAGIGMLAVGLLSGVVDNVVRPWVLKGRADLHPLVSLVAIFGSVHFFGILGVLLGPVLAACLIEFLKVWPKVAPELGLDPAD